MLFQIISIGSLLVLCINFHADLISNFAIPLFWDTVDLISTQNVDDNFEIYDHHHVKPISLYIVYSTSPKHQFGVLKAKLSKNERWYPMLNSICVDTCKYTHTHTNTQKKKYMQSKSISSLLTFKFVFVICNLCFSDPFES